VRTILFHRKFRRLHGGHLKVWHYFNHVLATPGFDARALFDRDSAWDTSNPWAGIRERVVESIDDEPVDALFVAGRDWQRLDSLGLLDRELPILNLIQHVRHADDWSIQSHYLSRKAIRICVSDEVADALRSRGCRGPVVVIPNAVDVAVASDSGGERATDLLIAGLKQPAMATLIADRLRTSTRKMEVLTEHVPREEFLNAMRTAKVTLFLPNEEEGFYLPALEGMALGTIVVCPDCVGNRTYCIPGENALRPAFEVESLVAAAETALRFSSSEATRLTQNGLATARQHSPAAEREAFQSLLLRLDEIWAGG
jgi:hypothetical protein